MSISEIFNKLRSTSSKKAKEQILKDNSGNRVLQEIAKYTYDKINITYGIKKYNSESTEVSKKTIDEDWANIKSVLKTLKNRNITGNAAIELLESESSYLEPESRKILASIIDRDWGCGLSASTINKAWPDTIPTFDVVLAKSFEGKAKQLKSLEEDTWYISRKLDGCRCIAIREDGNWTYWSRQGKQFLTLDKVSESLDFYKFPDGTVLDGEICLTDADGNEDFQGVMKVIRKKEYTIENPNYCIFDILTIQEFYSKSSTRTFSERTEEINTYIKGESDCVSQLAQTEYTEEDFAILQKRSDDNNWEGLMLRKDVGYEGKRTNNLLKVKQFDDAEYTVESLEIGKLIYQEKGIGSVTYEGVTAMNITHKGNRVSVGSGLSKAERLYYINNQDELIGKVITVNYFEETTSKDGKHSLRFPTLKVIHGKERDT
jgi:DNA ligase-1